MKRLTKYAKADLLTLEQMVSHFANLPLDRDRTKEPYAALQRLLTDIGISCEENPAFSGIDASDLIALLRASFRSQFEEVSIVPKSEVGKAMLQFLSSRVASHAHEPGPTSCWDQDAAQDKLHVALDDKQCPIGIVHMIGEHKAPIDIGWWIDPLYQGRRFAYPMLDACADFLKARGATRVWPLRINDAIPHRSDKLAFYFNLHFPRA